MYERIILAGKQYDAERIATFGGEFFRFEALDKRERIIHVDNPGITVVRELPARIKLHSISGKSRAAKYAAGDRAFRGM